MSKKNKHGSNNNGDEPSFMHESEKEFASVLDFYGVPYEYEHKTFPLEWNEEGKILEAFTPDFYLPEDNMYIELTTMRQDHVTKKNRKLRKLRELYPDIKIKLLYRRDYLSLARKFGW